MGQVGDNGSVNFGSIIKNGQGNLVVSASFNYICDVVPFDSVNLSYMLQVG